MSERINVYIRALDPLSQAGVMHTLRHRPEVWLLTEEDLATERVADPSVALVVTENVDEETVKVLESVHQFGRRRVVLVASRVEDGMLLAAVEAGVCSVVPRAHATAERLVHALQTTASGAGSLPPDLLGRLLAQVSKLQRHVLAPHGLSRTGLSDRETEVLRMVADGMDTREIADRLGYSERTVKNVLHDITSRLQLKNRSHAVAYALREGLI
ncbi:helix-turn-helix transcriptional regulator [Actinopolymorpha pittospori]|uniref:DNA-binding NarL/FixJ family response regulator n=1 Tax=Actinopolymorpha pittospori TaxID=648752 RepID=A0A927RE18_9ACTN|nr:response regulator transcription factor [Actinopolymorpha pittospori]MBE1611674.1 DNA-binding NarL/FixJ family response regulator [Actinopolymorpha pittospori]